MYLGIQKQSKAFRLCGEPGVYGWTISQENN